MQPNQLNWAVTIGHGTQIQNSTNFMRKKLWNVMSKICETGYGSRYIDEGTGRWQRNLSSIPGTWKRLIPFRSAQTSSWVHAASIESIPRVFSQEVKRSGGKPCHSFPSITEVKNEWSYKSTDSLVFVACTEENLHYSFHFIMRLGNFVRSSRFPSIRLEMIAHLGT